MSTGERAILTDDEPANDDPFRYGWRCIERDGQPVQVPLTLEDVLHPQEGDHVTNTNVHHQICTYLHQVFCEAASKAPGTEVLADCRIDWGDPELGAHGPDVAVIFGVREHKEWGTFYVAVEGVRPSVIIEVTSRDTRRMDLHDKKDAYERAGVAIYVIIDLVSRRNQPAPRLVGHILTEDGYEALAPDALGRLWLEPLGLWLRLIDGAVVCENKDGIQYPDYVHINRQLENVSLELKEAKAEAEAEVRARMSLEDKLRAAEEEIRRLRGEK